MSRKSRRRRSSSLRWSKSRGGILYVPHYDRAIYQPPGGADTEASNASAEAKGKKADPNGLSWITWEQALAWRNERKMHLDSLNGSPEKEKERKARVKREARMGRNRPKKAAA